MRFLKFSLLSLIFFSALASGFYLRNFRESFIALEITVQKSNLGAADLHEHISEAIAEQINLAKEKIYTLLFVGDLMLSRKVGYYINKFNDPRYPFLKLADTLNAADFTFGNLEGPISNRGSNQGSIYSFRADPKVIKGIKYGGFDMLSIANNHIWDWGEDAIKDTISTLRSNNIIPIGAGNNYREANDPEIIQIGNAKLAFFSYTNLYPPNLFARVDRVGVSEFSVAKIETAIKNIRKSVDAVVISLHWGNEYETHSNANQEMIAHTLIDAGADLVIGHHPHVVQEIESYKNGWIVYSLGNFVFDQGFSEATKNGIMAKVILKDKKIISLEPIRIRLNATFQPAFIGS